MTERKKHWTELGRAKRSAWFQKLPEIDQKSILLALEQETFSSARDLVKFLAFIYLAAIYSLTFGIWSGSFHSLIPLFLGISLGGVLGVFAGIVLGKQKTLEELKSMQVVVGRTLGFPSVVICGISIALCLGKFAFMH